MTQLYNLLQESELLENALQSDVDSFKKAASEVRQRLTTAKEKGLGPNLLADTLALDLNAKLLSIECLARAAREKILSKMDE